MSAKKAEETNDEKKEPNYDIDKSAWMNKNKSRFDERIHSAPMSQAPRCRFEQPRLTSIAIATTIKCGISQISKADAYEMRKEYLNIMDDKKLNFKQMKNKIYFEIIDPVYSILGAKPQEIEFKFFLCDKNKNKIKTYKIKQKMISLGRRPENDIVLCRNSLYQVSRVQAYIFVANNQIILYDMWSVCGTTIVQRSNLQKQCVSTLPKHRNILIFDINEAFHLNVCNTNIHLLVVPKGVSQKQIIQLFQIYEDMKNIHNKKQYKKKELNAKQKEFKNWMCNEMGLEEYYNISIENGFDDIEVVSLLNDEDLKNIGIEKRGSRMKILLYFKKQKMIKQSTSAEISQNEGNEISCNL